METVERLVQTYMTSERDEEVEALVTGIEGRTVTLLQIVKTLGPYLTSEEGLIRTKGIRLLSSVIQKSKPANINSHSVKVLTTFYRDKLEDSDVLAEVLKGLLAITKLPAFGGTEAVDAVKSIADSIDMRTRSQSVRYGVFQVMDSLITNQRSALKDWGTTFITNWLKIASGEKDPRNLLLAFAIYRVVLIEFDISAHIDDLFENTFCYLPITFKPPPNDPYGITTEDLVKALRSVIAATPEFGFQAVPLCLEKLALGSPPIRRDVLQTLTHTLPIYGPGIASKYSEELWKTIKIEIFQPTDPSTEADALRTILTLIETIYSDSSISSSGDITGLAEQICSECNELLQEPDKNQAKPALKVLGGLLTTSESLAKHVLQTSFPPLLALFVDPNSLSSRRSILTCLMFLISALNKHSMDGPGTQLSDLGLLEPYKDQLLGAMTVGLKDPNSKEAALLALSCSVESKNLFTEDEIGFIVHSVNEVTFSNEDDEDNTWSIAVDLLKKIGEFAPAPLESITLPILFGSLPDRVSEVYKRKHTSRIWRNLHALERLCLPSPLFQTLVIRFLAKVDVICGIRYQSSLAKVEPIDVDYEKRAAYAQSLLLVLANVLAKKAERKDPDIPKYVKELRERLYTLLVASAIHLDSDKCVATHPKLLQTAADIGTLMARSLDSSQQAVFYDTLFKVFLLGNLDALRLSTEGLPTEFKFHPLQATKVSEKKTLLLLFTPLCAVRPTTALPLEDLNTFASNCLAWIGQNDVSDTQRNAILKALAGLINKKPENFEGFLNQDLKALWSESVANAHAEPSKRHVALQNWTWIVKGLIFRNHPSSISLVDMLFDCLDDDVIGWDAGRNFGVIAQSDDVLSKKNHAVIKLLYSQRYANHVMPKVIKRIQGASSSSKTAPLMALTSLIRSIPKGVYQTQLPDLMPLLLQGLDLPDDALRASVLDTLNNATKEEVAGALISEYASNLVTTMLKLSLPPSNGQTQSPELTKARLAALRFLRTLPDHVRYDILHPQRQAVLRGLGGLLDDGRRSIRTEAVETRHVWYTYSGSIS